MVPGIPCPFLVSILLIRLKQQLVGYPLYFGWQVDGQGTLPGLQVVAHLVELGGKDPELKSTMFSPVPNTRVGPTPASPAPSSVAPLAVAEGGVVDNFILFLSLSPGSLSLVCSNMDTQSSM